MFHFVPRKVAHRARPPLSAPDPPVPRPSSPTPTHTSTPDQEQHLGTGANKSKGKNKAADGTTDQDLATLLTLSLSDHALWIDVDLRRAVSTGDDGWIPLSFLVQHSTYLLHLNQPPPDSAVVRAIRGHAEDVLEVRMLVTAPSKEAWYGNDPSTSKDDGGGYEIRLKHSADALARVRNSARSEWEHRTVYVENVPLAHRTTPGIHRFLSSLLPVPTPSSPPPSTGPPLPGRIQTITLPPHHLDRPGAPPKSKGFALVTFASVADATRLATDWPWLPRRASVPDEGEGEGKSEGEGETKEEAKKKYAGEDAVKFGFRALPKSRWDALKDEYLEHRQRLLDALARADADTDVEHQQRQHPRAALPPRERGQGRARCPPTRTPIPTPESEAEAEAETETEPTAPPPLAPSAPYPPGCLVFVRNVHPETNKTTLKALLAAHAPPAAAALDYVDYAKGMASCHVRTAAPPHARALVAAFADRPLAQTHGLDGAGAPPPSAADPPAHANATRITAELVDGEREALYWHRVPEKVRREAVRTAIAHASVRADGDGGGDNKDAEMAGQGQGQGQDGRRGLEGEEETKGKRARKRRRRA